ncbi:hypothetical protein EHW97_09540, partial [Aeromicrobium camelliae]
MFTHQKASQFDVKVQAPDPAFARRFQEVLGGKWGEMTVAMQYLYQGAAAGFCDSGSCRLRGDVAHDGFEFDGGQSAESLLASSSV